VSGKHGQRGGRWKKCGLWTGLSRKGWRWDADERLSNATFPGKKEMCRLGVNRGITTKEIKTSAIFVTSRY